MDLHPGFLLSFFIGEQPTSHLPKMLAGVVEIDNLNRARKVQVDKIPNPFGAVANHNLLECAAPATSPSFRIDSPAKLFRTLDGSGVGGGIGIADWIALLIPPRLAEDASQFDFPSMGRLARALALPTDRLFLHHRDTRPIHLHVQDAHRLADNHGQLQLEGFLDLRLFAPAISAPMASAVRSTDLVVTSRPARTLICSR